MKFDSIFEKLYEQNNISTSFNYNEKDPSAFQKDIKSIADKHNIDEDKVTSELKKILDSYDSDDIIIHMEVISKLKQVIRDNNLDETYDGISKVDGDIPNMNKGFLK
tara:strand:- start:5 stop:325 length:321 start_codon:yes stop_codon:yes gene_type:complete